MPSRTGKHCHSCFPWSLRSQVYLTPFHSSLFILSSTSWVTDLPDKSPQMDMLISAVLGEAVGRSIDFFIRKCSKPQAVQDVEGRLGSVLLRAQVIIDEAMARQVTNQAMLQQLAMLRGAMHRGYYMLDSFRYQQYHSEEDAKEHLVSQSLSLCKLNSFCSSGKTHVLEQLQEVLDSLYSMILDASELVVFLKSCPHMYRQPYSMHLLLANSMFDRKMETERVVSFLLSKKPHHDEKPEVLPIVGPCRVGKSTLVAHVCKDERIRDHFSEVVFLTNHDLRDEMLSAGLRRGSAPERHHVFTTRKDGRLLAIVEVAGDVTQDTWDRLCSAFRRSASNGTKIIVTSRSDKIKELGTAGAVTLTYPSNEAFWYFFRTLTFGSTDPEQHPRLASVAMEIARVLGNRSLISANVTACLLRDNFDINFWCKALS
ncbi:hypothetical protein PVAP13_5KG251300 [Panicum virgatum]|uniref:NB-ARC domain-containing protein n=1 Tax=Panicum virgatum TaxID=38727 RepID=A0A8T0SNG1_PANVG|nr:hypothetical protein PVAP13_5KG251300 [Panicum virgatum]